MLKLNKLKPIKLYSSVHLDQTSHSNFSRLLPSVTQSRYFCKNAKKHTDSVNFQSVVDQRRLEAARSILVEASTKDYNSLVSFCLQFGPITRVYRQNGINNSQRKFFYLIEFQEKKSATEAIHSSVHKDSCFESNVPIRSRFFMHNSKGFAIKRSNNNQSANVRHQIEVNTAHRDAILNSLRQQKSIDAQLKILLNRNQISDLSYRLRYMAALQIEEAISGFFSNAKVLPFGSSVNGFGRMQSDLDIVVAFEDETKKGNALTFINETDGMQSKSPRQALQSNLQILSSVMKHWLPGISEVKPILHARVPIIKYFHNFTGLECDLSMGSMSGYYMSEIFHMFGQIDERVQPLVFFIRRWAEECQLTNKNPGPFITNFMLTCSVIFFLQQLEKPILPPFNSFVEKAQSSDRRMTDDKVNCTYLRDLAQLNFKTANTSSLQELLTEYFQYYSTFEFENNAISIPSGRIEARLAFTDKENSSMDIINPLQQELNVSRNVTDFECKRFMDKCKVALSTLTEQSEGNILALLDSNQPRIKKHSINSFVANIAKGGRRNRTAAEKLLSTEDTNPGSESKKFDFTQLKLT